jgi:hypothetical protein
MSSSAEGFFEGKDEEFIRFERVEHKLSNRPDIHAFLLLDQLCPGTRDMVSAAEHDEIYLDVDVKELLERATDEQLIDLHRCGVRAGDNGLAMFV